MKNKDKKVVTKKYNFLEAEKVIREQRNKQNITKSNKSFGLLFE